MIRDIANLRLIYPASKHDSKSTLPESYNLKNGQLRFNHKERSAVPNWEHLAAPLDVRLNELIEALHDEEADAIICGRGGYGASDLLIHLPWEQLRSIRPKLLIGFSDISALHSAFYTKLGWPGLHGPMPATSYWGEHPDLDLPLLLEVIKNPTAELRLKVSLLASTDDEDHSAITGTLFGGCLSVLSNLIGTPFFPFNLAGSIVFWEDIDEPVGRIFRHINQWIQSGSLHGVQAIVLGRFTSSSKDRYQEIDLAKFSDDLMQRTGVQVFSCPEFGHCSPNLPLMVGGQASIEKNQLLWKRSPYHGSLTS